MHKMLQKAYLVAYNTTMFGGWSLILLKIMKHFASGGNVEDIYPIIVKLLVIFQSGAVMEIVHAMTGIVRSPVGTTFLQVISRLMVLYGSLEIGDTASRQSPFLPQLIIAWSLSEIIRYAFYATNLLEVKIKPLTWLRYSAFTVLYPIGISAEIACLYKALPFIKANKPWTMELPNRYNCCFSWYSTIWVILALYPYGSYVMYSYMLAQRRKVLSNGPSAGPENLAMSGDKSGDTKKTK